MAKAMQRAIVTSSSTRTRWPARRTLRVLLPFAPLVIAAIALCLRLQGLDWDGGALYHPDERSIVLRAEHMYRALTAAPGWEAAANRDFPLDEPGIPGIASLFDADRSPLNPHWFPLGSIIIYLLVGVRFLIDPFMDQVRLQDLASAGRVITALVDTAGVLVLFALGKRVFGRPVGLLAALLASFSVIGIQVAHFYRPEPFVVLLVLVSFWWMLNIMERRRPRDHVLLGVIVGLSFAFRTTSIPLLLPLAFTYGTVAMREYRGAPPEQALTAAYGIARRAAAAGAIAFVVFALLQPYALLDFGKFISDQVWEGRIARTAGLVPYTIQYTDTARGLYELRQSAIWALGLPLGIAAWAGLVFSLGRVTWRSRYGEPRLGEILLVVWVVPFLLLVAFFEVKFLRYLVPVLPVMILLGSRWMIAAMRFGRRRSRGLGCFVVIVGVFVIIATAFYGTSFVRSYGEPHPAIAASAWLNANAGQKATILTDNHWDEGFTNLGRFRVEQLRMYEEDSISKLSEVTSLLAEADFLAAYSNRPFGSIARSADRYPLSSAYYRLLFDGSLGYELVQAFERYPTLLGVSFAHDPFTRAGVTAPTTLPGIANTGLTLHLGYADENITNYDRPLVLIWHNVERADAEALQQRILSQRSEPSGEPLLLDDEARARQQEGGTWSTIFSESDLNRRVPWLIWLALTELIYLLAIPLSVTLFRWLPDRGMVLARPLGLLITAWLVWVGASTGVWTFGRGSIAFSMLFVGAVSGALLWRRRGFMLVMARRHWRFIAGMEALFLLAFFVFLIVRSANPDLWHPFRGGEKPMDLSYLIAVVRSTSFPPYDPWYAGGFINYYYFGFVVVGMLIKATGIVPDVAYNLALALLFSLAVTGSFTIGHNLAEALRQRARQASTPLGPLAAGTGAALLVVVLANVDGAAQLLQASWRSFTGEPFGPFDFWRSSRLMPGQISITEFPFWTFLFGDLHAHLIAIPFGLLALGTIANVALGAHSPLRTQSRLPAIAGMAFSVGSLAAINTWDVPAYGLLGLVTIGIFVTARHGPLSMTTLMHWAAWGFVFWGLLYALWLPFHQNYEAPFAGIRFSQWRTVLWHYLGIHAILIFAVGTWVALEAKRRLFLRVDTWRPWIFGVLLFVAAMAALPATRPWLTATLLSGVGLLILLMSFSWLARRRSASAPVHLLLLAMVGVAVAIGVGVDVLTLQNDIDRMNTVFKLYLNAWVFLGIVGGVGLWHVWATGALRGGKATVVWSMMLLVILAASAVYPILGTRARLADRFNSEVGLTLNGAVFRNTAVYHDPGPDNQGRSPGAIYPLIHDAEALEFLRQNVDGSPVVLEGVTTQYRWTPRVAVYTGLPVLVGWEWHQVQQRGAGGAEPAAVRRRIADVRTMYTTTDTAWFMKTLRGYGISYIYVGPAERLYFPAAGIEKFEALVGNGLEHYFSNSIVTIYSVQ